MDVRKLKALGCLWIALISLAACSQKTATSAFPENSQQSQGDCISRRIKNKFIVQWEDGRTTVETDENVERFIARFLEPNLALIRHVEFDKRIELQQDALSFETFAEAPNWGQTMVEASYAWNQNVLGQGVKVGVVDAAVDYTHPQLKPRLSVNTGEIAGNNFDDDQNGLMDDRYGWDFYGGKDQPYIAAGNVHGSHVAGIILADHDFGPVDGVAPRAGLVPANFMDQSGGGDLSDAIQAIQYVASRGVKVINASWGGEYCSQALKDTVSKLAQKNILFVVAAGNAGADLDSKPEFPAAFELGNQLTIGATRSTDRMSGFSNTSFRFVQLAAPGENITSTIPGGSGTLSGTSMAAPFVSGTAALLWSDRPNATVAQIREAIINSVDVRDYRVMTRGRLNIRKALTEIRRLVP